MMNTPSNDSLLANVMVGQANSGTDAPPLKELSLAEFLPPLISATQQNQPWVQDFGSDAIMLPPDLYEVIKAFTCLQAPRQEFESAADIV